jgi:protein-tyrosine-phosphatase
MAEYMAREWAPICGMDVQVRSASTLGLVDRAADPKVVAVCHELDLDLTPHRSQPLTVELVLWADRIGVMEIQHATAVHDLVPDLPSDTVIPLAAFVGKAEIADPIGGWTKRPFRVARDEIRVGVLALLESMPMA